MSFFFQAFAEAVIDERLERINVFDESQSESWNQVLYMNADFETIAFDCSGGEKPMMFWRTVLCSGMYGMLL